MTTEIISDVDFNDPTNLIPYLEKDDAIIRNITKGMLDWSNTACFNQSPGLISTGAVATSLTSDGATGAAASNFLAPGVQGGLLDFSGTGRMWTMPNSFKLAASTKKFMVIVWAKMPPNGHQTASGNISVSLLGYMNNTSNLAQWGFYLQTIQATGLPNIFAYITPSNAGGSVVRTLSNADTLALCDGNLHQIALVFDGETTAGQVRRSLYVDKVIKDDATTSWDGTFNIPSAAVQLGTNIAFQSVYPTGWKAGRPSMWDLTGNTVWTPTQILQRDWDAAQGWLS